MFQVILLLICLMFNSIEASDVTRQLYLDLAAKCPRLVHPQGLAVKGEIEILLDPKEMLAIEQKTGRDVGIIMRDKYWLWVNDACRFPSGQEGVYGRILWVKALEGTPGVAVMPILPDGRIVLNCNYRHGTRSWEMELPRGCVNLGESAEDAARRETLEETGMRIEKLIKLGECPSDTGITGTLVPIYAAKVIEKIDAEVDGTEAIEEIVALTVAQIKQALVQGYHTCTIRGKEQRVPFRDLFLAYAVLLYELKMR